MNALLSPSSSFAPFYSSLDSLGWPGLGLHLKDSPVTIAASTVIEGLQEEDEVRREKERERIDAWEKDLHPVGGTVCLCFILCVDVDVCVCVRTHLDYCY